MFSRIYNSQDADDEEIDAEVPANAEAAIQSLAHVSISTVPILIYIYILIRLDRKVPDPNEAPRVSNGAYKEGSLWLRV